MSRQIDFDKLVRDAVVSEVREALAPYRQMFERMAALMGQSPGGQRGSTPMAVARPPRRNVAAQRIGPPSPAPAVPVAAKPARPRFAAPAADAPPAPTVAAKADRGAPIAAIIPFSVGQRVVYKVGQGEIEATVVAIAGNQLVLDRIKDGKRVKRPIAKVAAA